MADFKPDSVVLGFCPFVSTLTLSCLKETLAPLPPRGLPEALPDQDPLRGVQHLQPGGRSPARPEEVPWVPGSQGSCGHSAARTGQHLWGTVCDAGVSLSFCLCFGSLCCPPLSSDLRSLNIHGL